MRENKKRLWFNGVGVLCLVFCLSGCNIMKYYMNEISNRHRYEDKNSVKSANHQQTSVKNQTHS